MLVSGELPWKSRLQYAMASFLGPSGNQDMCVAVRLSSLGSLNGRQMMESNSHQSILIYLWLVVFKLKTMIIFRKYLCTDL